MLYRYFTEKLLGFCSNVLAKDIEELNAKNIEYPDGSMHTLYDAEQQQRAFERKIRATKRTLAACDEALNNLSDEELLQKLEKIFSHYSSKLKRQESELNSFCKKQDYFLTVLVNRLMVLIKVLLKKRCGKIRNKRLMRRQIVLLEIQAGFWSLIAKQVFIKVAPKHSFFMSILYYLLQIQLLNDNVIPIL